MLWVLHVGPTCIGETWAGRDKKVLLQSHADRQADRRFMTTSNEILMSLLSTETFKKDSLRTIFFQNAIKQGNPICLDLPRSPLVDVEIPMS
jgi:hypothetical protein